ncbi:hypothetical protein [Nocardia asiatica]|uniref:hypothetical protein n=1 Tax=Nocardia asiatica TaxID=209252 RepID=UPI00245801DF|nr:hypothetical protein [Nocardia asiatica]
MPNDETPRVDWEQVAANLRQAGEGFARAGQTWTVQGAMGWMFRGDIDRARDALRRIPRERLVEVSAAAAALSSLADEIAAEPGEPQ